MNNFKKLWEDNNQTNIKTLFEPKRNIDVEATMNDHRKNCSTRPSILVGVCRGKLSEGYDFKDSLARVVI